MDAVTWTLIRQDLTRLLAAVVPELFHEINNHNQSILLGGQVMVDVWSDLRRVLDRYRDRNGDFTAGGISYSVLSQELGGYLSQIVRGARGIDGLAAELRGLYRAPEVPVFESVDLNRVVSSAVHLLQHLIRRCTDHFELQRAEHLPPVHGCAPWLTQAVLHLLRNACAALPDRQRRVTLKTDSSPGRVLCEVLDEGRGLPEGAGKRDTGGLAACRLILAEHGGELRLESRAGEGTRAQAWLPALAASAEG